MKTSAITFVMRTVSVLHEEENYDHTEFSRKKLLLCRARCAPFSFHADWCTVVISLFQAGRLEAENPTTFILIDRVSIWDLAKVWDVYGIPSLVVLERIMVCQSRLKPKRRLQHSSRIGQVENHDCNTTK